MNHDYTHCADYTTTCPDECFRSQLVKDLSKFKNLTVSWASFKNTDECKLK